MSVIASDPAGGNLEDHTLTRSQRSAQRRSTRAVHVDMQPADWVFIALPFLVFAALAASCRYTNVDLRVSRYFYSEAEGIWPMADAQPCVMLYRRGCLPALCLGIAGLVVGLISSFVPRLERLRKPGFYLALVLALGPGLIVNAILKPCIGRPRPAETIPFGGDKQFVSAGALVGSTESKSFPSGHASMGFFLMTPALLYYRRRPLLALATLAAGVAYGALIGAARIAQGAHFTSDVIAAALCVYVTAIIALGVIRLVEWRTRSANAKTEHADGESPEHTVPFLFGDSPDQSQFGWRRRAA